MTGIEVVRSLLQETSDGLAREGLLPESVSHYTSLGTLPHLLRAGETDEEGGLGSLWATSVRFLNDRQEFTAGWETLREDAAKIESGVTQARRRLEPIRQLLESDDAGLGLSIYSVSFSGSPDELGQWRGYANDGYGASVVFSRSALDARLGALSDTLCGPVVYDPVEQGEFARRLLVEIHAKSLTLDEASQALQLAAVFMKHPGFSAEREYRLVRVATAGYRMRESRRRLVPFLDPLDGLAPIPLEKVIVGPAWQLPRQEDSAFGRHHVPLGVRMALDLCGLRTIDVHPSAIPYDPS